MAILWLTEEQTFAIVVLSNDCSVEATNMSELKDVITSYNSLSFCDRIVFYTTISNDIPLTDDIQSFLIETRFGGNSCICCNGMHVVKNGKRRDGTQRYLCRDCHRSFIPSSDSITSRTRKSVSIWAAYLKCMLEQKTLKETSEECHMPHSAQIMNVHIWTLPLQMN